jgi:hypothetical protein
MCLCAHSNSSDRSTIPIKRKRKYPPIATVQHKSCLRISLCRSVSPSHKSDNKVIGGLRYRSPCFDTMYVATVRRESTFPQPVYPKPAKEKAIKKKNRCCTTGYLDEGLHQDLRLLEELAILVGSLHLPPFSLLHIACTRSKL